MHWEDVDLIVGVDEVVPGEDHVQLSKPCILTVMCSHRGVEPEPVPERGGIHVWGQKEAHWQIQDGGILPQEVHTPQSKHSCFWRQLVLHVHMSHCIVQRRVVLVPAYSVAIEGQHRVNLVSVDSLQDDL